MGRMPKNSFLLDIYFESNHPYEAQDPTRFGEGPKALPKRTWGCQTTAAPKPLGPLRSHTSP